jgi:hypothetical protein
MKTAIGTVEARGTMREAPERARTVAQNSTVSGQGVAP